MSALDRFRLDGRCAMVTGGSRGLGRAMAQSLAEGGADLVLVGRDAEQLRQAQQELAALGRRVEVVPADLESPAGAQDMCATVLAEHRPIDILVNNVGGRRINVATEDLALDDWRRLMDLNLTSAFLCTKLIGGEVTLFTCTGSSVRCPPAFTATRTSPAFTGCR